MIRKYKKDATIIYVGNCIDPLGYSGYDPNDPEKVKRNPDGTIHIYQREWSILKIELECGHFIEAKTTGWLPGEAECHECEIKTK